MTTTTKLELSPAARRKLAELLRDCIYPDNDTTLRGQAARTKQIEVLLQGIYNPTAAEIEATFHEAGAMIEGKILSQWSNGYRDGWFDVLGHDPTMADQKEMARHYSCIIQEVPCDNVMSIYVAGYHAGRRFGDEARLFASLEEVES